MNLVREFMEHFLGGSAPLRQMVNSTQMRRFVFVLFYFGLDCSKFFADQLLQGNIALRHLLLFEESLFISWWINLFTNGASQNELLSKKSPMHKIRNSFIGFSFRRLELKQQSWTLGAFILIWEWKALQKCKRGH